MAWVSYTAFLALVTLRCTCDYLTELSAFDQIVLRMRLGEQSQNRLTMVFDYLRIDPAGGREELVARGEQQVACLRRDGDRLVPTPIPDVLSTALRAYTES